MCVIFKQGDKSSTMRIQGARTPLWDKPPRAV